MFKNFFLIVIFFSVQFLFAQKTSLDTIGNSRYITKDVAIIKKLQLVDLNTKSQDFYFRLSFHGTKIDFWKDSVNQYNGLITKYIFQSKKDVVKDTLFEKYLLSPQQLVEIVASVDFTKLETIPDDSKIPEWRFGFHGVTYTLENKTKQSYSVKSYWTPKAQDSTLSESVLINNFIDSFLIIVKNDSITKEFQNSLSAGYSYSNGSSIHFLKLKNSYANIDYAANYRLPVGMELGFYIDKIKKKKIGVGGGIKFQHGFDENYSLGIRLIRASIFPNNKLYFDNIQYIFEKNKLKYVTPLSSFQTHSIVYKGFIEKWFDFSLGYTNLNTDKNQNGIYFGIAKKFDKINVKPYFDIQLYENATNYNMGIEKSFLIETESKRFRFYTSLYFEKIFNYKSLNISLNFPIDLFFR